MQPRTLLMVQRSVWMTTEAPQNNAMLMVLCGSRQLGFFTRQEDAPRLHSFELYRWQGQPDYLDCIQEATAQSSLYQQHYASTTIVWQDAPALLLPGAMASPEAAKVAKAMLSLQTEGNEYCEPLGPYQLWWHGPASIKTALYQTMAPAAHRHLYQLMGPAQPPGMYLYIHGSLLSMAAYGSQLLWMQQYQFETPEDILYHTLNGLQTLGLPLEDTVVYISGFFVVESSLYQTLVQYIPRLTLQEMAEPPGTEPAHSFTLFEQAFL